VRIEDRGHSAGLATGKWPLRRRRDPPPTPPHRAGGVRRPVGQILFAGEEAQHRAAPVCDVVVDRGRNGGRNGVSSLLRNELAPFLLWPPESESVGTAAGFGSGPCSSWGPGSCCRWASRQPRPAWGGVRADAAPARRGRGDGRGVVGPLGALLDPPALPPLPRQRGALAPQPALPATVREGPFRFRPPVAPAPPSSAGQVPGQVAVGGEGKGDQKEKHVPRLAPREMEAPGKRCGRVREGLGSGGGAALASWCIL
jgi:hypothetical protein